MIPSHILDYLNQHEVDFGRLVHRRAVTASRLAQSLHLSGRRVAKAVLVDADGTWWICVVPATAAVDLERVGAAVGASRARLLAESDFGAVFRDCEIGAEPPFGSLYSLPVLVDEALADEDWIVFRAGSHDEAIGMAFSDFARLEFPRVRSIATASGGGPR